MADNEELVAAIDRLSTRVGATEIILSRVAQQIDRIPERCEAEAKAIAVLQSQAEWALPDHDKFEKQISKIEVAQAAMKESQNIRTGLLAAFMSAVGAVVYWLKG